MTLKTPIYQIEYLAQGEPVRNTRLALENNAKSIEAALKSGGLAPQTVQDALAVIGRVTTLETGRPAAPTILEVGTAAVSTYAKAGYYRDRAGLVHLSSIAPVSTAGLAANVALFTLPAGYRPTALLPLMLPVDSAGTTPAGPRLMRWDLATDGRFYSPAAVPANSGFYVWLDSIQFPAP